MDTHIHKFLCIVQHATISMFIDPTSTSVDIQRIGCIDTDDNMLPVQVTVVLEEGALMRK